MSNPLIYTQIHTDSITGKAQSVLVTNEPHQIAFGQVQLNEIANSYNHVTITEAGYNEIRIDQEIIDDNSFKCDYNTGLIYFNPSQNGLTLNFNYAAVGIIFIDASRIATKNIGTIVTQTLKELTDGTNIAKDNTIIATTNAVTAYNNSTNFNFTEDYDSNYNYVPLNKVTYGGNMYQNIVACQGVYPTDTNHWLKIVTRGLDGFSSIIESSFTATIDSTTHIITGLTNFDPTHDYLEASYCGEILKKDISYSLSEDNLSIDLINGWSINIGEIINFKLYKNLNEPDIQTEIGNAITAKSNLDASVITGNTTKNALDQSIQNGTLGNLSDSLTIDKSSFINAINENVTRLNGHDTQLVAITNQNKGIPINLFTQGCTVNTDDATTNTTIIQGLLNLGKTILVTDLFPINSTITLPKGYTGKIKGINRATTGFLQLTDNIPIIKTELEIRYSSITNLYLKYNNSQQNNTNAIAIYITTTDFTAPNLDYFNFYNIKIENAYSGIESNPLCYVWNCNFQNIALLNIWGRLIKIVNSNSSQLNNTFIKIENTNWTIFNVQHLSNDGKPAFEVNGAYTSIGLDIEDWKIDGQPILINAGNSTSTFLNIHLERIHLLNPTISIFNVSQQCFINDINLYNITYATVTQKVNLFMCGSAPYANGISTLLTVNGVHIGGPSTDGLLTTKNLISMTNYIISTVNINGYVVDNFNNIKGSIELWNNTDSTNAEYFYKLVSINGRKFMFTGTPSGGTWDLGETALLNDYGDSFACTQQGSKIWVGGMTGSITSGSNILTAVYPTLSVLIGQYITIVGVSGIKKVLNIVTNETGGVLTLDSNADATVTGATINHSIPVFTRIGRTIRSQSGTPINTITPNFVGEDFLDYNAAKFYKAVGLTSNLWVPIN